MSATSDAREDYTSTADPDLDDHRHVTVLAALYLRIQFTYARPAFELINIAFTYVRKQSLELIMLLRTHTPSGSN